MHSHEIERRLRLPAPDEPTTLPALVFPTSVGRLDGVRLGLRPDTFRSAGFWSPRLVLAMLALVLALVGAITTGALRLDRVPNPFSPTLGLAGRGIHVDYPRGWLRLTPDNPGNSAASTALIVSSTGFDGCSESDLGPYVEPTPLESGGVTYVSNQYEGPEDRIFECAIGQPMVDGEIRLTVSLGYPQKAGVGPMEPFDPSAWFGAGGAAGGAGTYTPTEADGWDRVIGERPAKLVVEASSPVPGAQEVRTWGIYEALGRVWFVRATLRGPDLAALRTQADAVATSLTFDDRAPVLDEARKADALARAIDATDREFREFRGSTIFGCFPRTPGERAVEIDQGPKGPLAEPVTVTCRTTIEATTLGLWRSTLVIDWPAGHGVPAGSWGWELLFDGASGNGSTGELFNNEAVAFPGVSFSELPPVLDGPLDVPIGSLVEVLPPGIGQAWGPVKAVFDEPVDAGFPVERLVYEAGPGRRFYVLGGPERHAGTDWYLVQAPFGTSFPGEYKWLPATDGNRPLIEVVEPNCPTGELKVTDLVYLHPAERLLCFGDRELTLAPAIASLTENVDGTQGTPEWLASGSPWRLFGIDGPDGVDGPIAVAISPSLGDSLPTGTLLTIHGHFDDPLAATCQRTIEGDGGAFVETAEIQHLVCREVFVVTSFERRTAP